MKRKKISEMKAKINYVIIIAGLFLTNIMYAQDKKTPAWLNNDSIHYTLGYQSGKYTDSTATLSKYVVSVDINKKQAKEINNFTYETWISLLEDEKTDFAANLLLYDIYNKNANLFFDLQMHDWEKFNKKDDVNYWIQELKKGIKKIDMKDF
jgi:hypothetical protein